jgi:hypothetical protein
VIGTTPGHGLRIGGQIYTRSTPCFIRDYCRGSLTDGMSLSSQRHIDLGYRIIMFGEGGAGKQKRRDEGKEVGREKETARLKNELETEKVGGLLQTAKE